MRKRLQIFELFYIRYEDGRYGYCAGPVKTDWFATVIAKFRVKITAHKISEYHKLYAIAKTDKALREYLNQ